MGTKNSCFQDLSIFSPGYPLQHSERPEERAQLLPHQERPSLPGGQGPPQVGFRVSSVPCVLPVLLGAAQLSRLRRLSTNSVQWARMVEEALSVSPFWCATSTCW